MLRSWKKQKRVVVAGENAIAPLSQIAAAPAGKTRNNIGREISDYVICGAIETAKSTR